MAKVKRLISMKTSLARVLEAISEITGMSQSEVIEKALDFYLNYIDGIIAERVSKGIKEGKMKVKEADEVFKRLGIKV
ncbi:ribbon-helix-helix domain-containing protein [Persephonella sp.]